MPESSLLRWAETKLNRMRAVAKQLGVVPGVQIALCDLLVGSANTWLFLCSEDFRPYEVRFPFTSNIEPFASSFQ